MITLDSRSDNFKTWFRSWVEVPQVQAKEQEDGSCDEYNSNERRILRDRSAILLGFKILLAEAFFEDVQALLGFFSGNQGLVVKLGCREL